MATAVPDSRRRTGPEKFDEPHNVFILKLPDDAERSVDVVIIPDVIKPPSGNRYLRIRLRPLDRPCTDRTNPALHIKI